MMGLSMKAGSVMTKFVLGTLSAFLSSSIVSMICSLIPRGLSVAKARYV